MFYNLPIVVAYKANPVTVFLIRKLLKIRYVSLGNIIADEEIIPELLQENCTAPKIAQQIIQSLKNATAIGYTKITNQLHNDQQLPPGALAAKTILALL